MKKINPYKYTDPATAENFVGRGELVKVMGDDLAGSQPNSWAVIGGRRFGKTSVLKAIERNLWARMKEHEVGNRYILPLFVDSKQCSPKSEEHIYGCFIRQLYDFLSNHKTLTLDLSKTKLSDEVARVELFQFENAVKGLAKLFEERYGPLRVVLLLDELEVMIQYGWSEILFNQLRALVHDGPISKLVKIVVSGSVKVVKARQEGSPLLNAVKIEHLQIVAKADIKRLIKLGGGVSDNVKKQILKQCGGHPYMAQYVLHHLWPNGLERVNEQDVKQVIDDMYKKESLILQGWWDSIGIEGQQAYITLNNNSGWMAENELLAQVARERVEGDVQSGNVNFKKVFKLLSKGFGEAELRRICYYETAFKPVREQLSTKTGLDEVVDTLIDYADQRDLIGVLLNWAKEENITKYQKYYPYYDIDNSTPNISNNQINSQQGGNTNDGLLQSLTTLCYHGLVIKNKTGQKYRVGGTLFGAWVLRYKFNI